MLRRVLARIARALDLTRLFELPAWHPVQGLFITDADGAHRMKVAVDSTGAPVVGLLDARGNTQAVLAISDATGSPQLVLFDRDGKPKMALHVGIDGWPVT